MGSLASWLLSPVVPSRDRPIGSVVVKTQSLIVTPDTRGLVVETDTRGVAVGDDTRGVTVGTDTQGIRVKVLA